MGVIFNDVDNAEQACDPQYVRRLLKARLRRQSLVKQTYQVFKLERLKGAAIGAGAGGAAGVGTAMAAAEFPAETVLTFSLNAPVTLALQP